MAIIDPEGLFNGDRLRRCSNVAQLHWPRLYLASDGFGRLELNYAKMLRAYSNFSPLPTEAELQAYLEEYDKNFLLFVYEADGQLWGQWDTKVEFLPRYKTSSDKRSPEPPKKAVTEWKRVYREQSRLLPKSFVNFSQSFQRAAHGGGGGDGVGEGTGGGIGGGGGGAESPPPPPHDLPVLPAEQRGSDGEPIATPSPENGEPIEVAVEKAPPPPLTALTVWQRDESYALLIAAWRAAKPDAIDADFERNYKYWVKFDVEQRQQAIANLWERARLGLETSSRLKYWLTEDYKRKVVPEAKGMDRNHRRRQEGLAVAKELRRK